MKLNFPMAPHFESKQIRAALAVLLFLAAWECASRSGVVPSALFPPPSKVLATTWKLGISGVLIMDLGVSLWKVLVGLAFGTIFGISIGLLTARSIVFGELIEPVIQLLRPLPPVSLIPLIVVWLGIGWGAKVAAIGFACFFPVWLNSHVGIRNIPQRVIWAARSLTDSRLKTSLQVLLPAALPFILAGIRSGIAVAFTMIFVSELTGASSGLGYLISISANAYRMDQMMAGLLALGACGAMVDYTIHRASLFLWPWLKIGRTYA